METYEKLLQVCEENGIQKVLDEMNRQIQQNNTGGR